MAGQTPTPGPSPSEAAAAAVAPDALTAEILRKYAAGEPLLPKESGKLGAFKSKLNKFFGSGSSKAQLPQPGQTMAVVAVEPASSVAQAAPDSPGPAPLDPALVRNTTAAILKTCDSLARGWVTSEARKIGADEATCRQFEQAVALQPGPRDLMVNTSPEVLAALGINAGNYPVAAFLTGATIWAGSILIAVQKLRASRHTDPQATNPAPSDPAQESKKAPGLN